MKRAASDSIEPQPEVKEQPDTKRHRPYPQYEMTDEGLRGYPHMVHTIVGNNTRVGAAARQAALSEKLTRIMCTNNDTPFATADATVVMLNTGTNRAINYIKKTIDQADNNGKPTKTVNLTYLDCYGKIARELREFLNDNRPSQLHVCGVRDKNCKYAWTQDVAKMLMKSALSGDFSEPDSLVAEAKGVVTKLNDFLKECPEKHTEPNLFQRLRIEGDKCNIYDGKIKSALGGRARLRIDIDPLCTQLFCNTVDRTSRTSIMPMPVWIRSDDYLIPIKRIFKEYTG